MAKLASMVFPNHISWAKIQNAAFAGSNALWSKCSFLSTSANFQWFAHDEAKIIVWVHFRTSLYIVQFRGCFRLDDASRKLGTETLQTFTSRLSSGYPFGHFKASMTHIVQSNRRMHHCKVSHRNVYLFSLVLMRGENKVKRVWHTGILKFQLMLGRAACTKRFLAFSGLALDAWLMRMDVSFHGAMWL